MFTGILRVWNCKTRVCVHSQNLPESLSKKDNESETDMHSLTQAFSISSLNQICTTNYEHNIQFFSTTNLQLDKQVCITSDHIFRTSQ